MPGRLSRRRLLLASAGGALGVTAGAIIGFPHILKKHGPRKDNILLVVCDAMRGDVIGKVVNGREVTPNINRLAEEGVCFKAAYSAAPATKFSVASIFSGMYPPGHGVEHHRFTLPDCPTISRYLSGKGYYALGLVTNPYLAPEIGPNSSTVPMRFGFNASFDMYRTLGARYAAQKRNIPKHLRRFSAFAGGETLNDTFFTLLGRQVPLFAGDAPVFVYLHYMDSHQPWLKTHPVKNITGKFQPGKPLSIEDAFAKNCKVISKLLFGKLPPEEISHDDLQCLKAVYFEGSAYADRCVGELLGGLKERGLYDNTTIILTSDHGDELLEHGRIGHGQNLFDTALHVPLIVKTRRLAPCQVDRRASNAMILPTVMEWFGDELPSTNVGSLPSRMDSPSLDSPEIFASFFGRDKVITGNGRTAMHHDGKYLCFDIIGDPGETRPLQEDPAVLNALRKARYASRMLAEEAGIVSTFSTYAWQNPDAPVQNSNAQQAVDRGEITPLQAALLKSTGHFMPAGGDRDLVKETGIDRRALSPEEKEQLSALGYLN